MGIKGLWEHLPGTSREESLLQFAVAQGFVGNASGLHAYRIGIDVASWLYHAQKVMGQTRNGDLQMFFHRCCRLLSAPVLPLFVFDGHNRPTFKRNKVIKVTENTQLNEIRALIAAFGFDCVTAPGEAEAALAQLNREGIIDAIISDDCDCFAFGAKTVLRSIKDNSKSKHMEHFDIYTAANLEKASFSREEILLIALLRGGDYDTGIDGCGITTAVNLRHLGFGKYLVEHWNKRDSSFKKWSEFLYSWRTEIKKELSTNNSHESGQTNKRAASNITDAFPDDEVISAYLNPIIFCQKELDHISKNLWKSTLSLSALSAFCFNRFQWGTASKILETFRHLVWPGVVMRMLLEMVNNIDNGAVIDPPFEIKSVKQSPAAYTSILLSTKVFVQEVKEGLNKSCPLNEDTITFPWRLMQKDRAVLANKVAKDELECFRIPSVIISTICPLAQNSANQNSSKNFSSSPDPQVIYISSDSD